MLGGACGAGLRYFFMMASEFMVASDASGSKTLWGILAANLVGCFLAGVLVSANPKGANPQLLYFVGIGVLGAITTLSAFSTETLALFGLPEKFVWLNAGAWLYFAATTFGGLAACVLGMRLYY